MTAKELKQPDEFVSATGKVVEWARENPEQAQKIAGAGLNFAAENPDVVRSAFK